MIHSDPNWPDKAELVAPDLKLLSEHWKTHIDVLSDSSKALKLTNDVLILVARHFHAGSKYPILEFPLPYLLKLIVLVCQDLQSDVLKIPGSHTVKLGSLLLAWDALGTLSDYKSIFNVGNWLVNWPGAAVAKARSVLFKKGLSHVTDEIAQYLIDAYIQKLGYYAIQLYSSQLTLEDIVPTDVLTKASKEDIATSGKLQNSVEPLRILVLGQVNTGKSSLINALFGEIKSAEGILPTTSDITPYILKHDDLDQAIILDSPGYGGLMHDDIPATLKQQFAEVDIILMVCNAVQPARQADVEQLQAIRNYFQEECRDQALPVFIVVATHLDHLRPIREWKPSYNIQQPKNSKAETIRDACEAIAKDLNLSLDYVVPACLASDKPVYNIAEGLIGLILKNLDDAQRVRKLRCLRRYQEQSYWQHFWNQARQAGHIA